MRERDPTEAAVERARAGTIYPEAWSQIVWTGTTPTMVYCALCRLPIPEDHEPRMIWKDNDFEAKFHDRCWNEISPDQIAEPKS